MISFTLDDLQPLLDGCASPLLLFEGDTLPWEMMRLCGKLSPPPW